MYTHVMSFTDTQDTTNHEVPLLTLEQDRTKGTDDGTADANDESDDEREFTDDEDGFIMMTPPATLSLKITTEYAATKVSFMHSMLIMLGDKLRNVPKNCQFHSRFDRKDHHPDVPLTKALALIKIKKDTLLHR
jgi:hypothetical protein